MSKHKKLARANLFLHLTLGQLIKLIGRIKGQRIIKGDKLKGPCITLSNHSSWFDFIFTYAAVYPKRPVFVAAEKMFLEKFGLFLRLAHCIPKKLFDSDLRATKKILAHLSQGHIVSIFPEGQIGMTGHSIAPGKSIAKLIKAAKVDVYVIKHTGACFTSPYWCEATFKGKFETKTTKIISKEDLESYSIDFIYAIIKKELYFDPYEYNKDHHHKYLGKSIKGAERVVFRCPDCEQVGLKTIHNILRCPSCNFSLTYDNYGFLGGIQIYELYKKQFDWYEKTIASNPLYSIKASVKLQSYSEDRKSIIDIDEGLLTLSKKGFDYVSASQHLFFDIANIPAIPSDLGINIQIYQNNQLYQFVFSAPYESSQFMILGEVLHHLSTNPISHGTIYVE